MKPREQKAWERSIKREHEHAAFYIDVRNGSEVVVAYDSKSGAAYGEFKPVTTKD